MSKTANIINIIQNAEKIDHGVFKFFISVSKDVGIKIMPCKITRNSNFKRQKRANKFKLGPNCWCPFCVVIDGNNWYGYFTEKTNKVEVFDVSEEEIDKLIIGLLRKVDFDFSWDANIRNLGFDKNNNLVCIDFDHFGDLGKNLLDYFGGNFKDIKKKFRLKLRKTKRRN